MIRPALFVLCLGLALPAVCQNTGILRVRSWRQQQEQPIIREFVSFLSIPNIAADSVNIQKNADFIVRMMKDGNIGPLVSSVTS